MKISSIKTETSYLQGRPKGSMPERMREKSVLDRANLKLNNDQINTTINENSDGRVSFKGGSISAPFLHKMANFASDNPLVAEAIFAILITCGMRPAAIMATAKTDEDKQKCSYQAAKSVSSGLVGLGMTALVATPLAAAVKRVNKNGSFKLPEAVENANKELVRKGIDALNGVKNRIQTGVDVNALTADGKFNVGVFAKKGEGSLKNFARTLKEQAPDAAKDIIDGIKAQKSNNNYPKAAKNIMDKFFQPAFMPLRASITIALVPILLKLVGLKKGGKPQQPPQNDNIYNSLYFGLNSDKAKEVFKTFAGVANYENK